MRMKTERVPQEIAAIRKFQREHSPNESLELLLGILKEYCENFTDNQMNHVFQQLNDWIVGVRQAGGIVAPGEKSN